MGFKQTPFNKLASARCQLSHSEARAEALCCWWLIIGEFAHRPYRLPWEEVRKTGGPLLSSLGGQRSPQLGPFCQTAIFFKNKKRGGGEREEEEKKTGSEACSSDVGGRKEKMSHIGLRR